jgi:peptide/nickel transport system permease protein
VTRYLIRRIFWAVWLFFVATFIVYVIFFLIPANPARITGVGLAASPALLAQIRSQLHLDVPFYQQYWIFVWNIIRHQSLGYSFQNGVSVRSIVAQAAPVTASLVLGGMVFWLLLSIPIGILSALKPRSLFDRGATLFVLIGISAPPFWLGLILAYVFGFKLGWFPIADYCNLSTHSGGECSGPARWAYHLILPWISITFLYAALNVRLIRSSMLDVDGEDFVRTARAKGASSRRVVVHHVLRNSLLPIVTVLGMDLALAFGAAVFIERVFNLPGLGSELLISASRDDVPVVVGVVVCITFVVIVLNFIVDVLYAWLDPRIRLDGSVSGQGF